MVRRDQALQLLLLRRLRVEDAFVQQDLPRGSPCRQQQAIVVVPTKATRKCQEGVGGRRVIIIFAARIVGVRCVVVGCPKPKLEDGVACQDESTTVTPCRYEYVTAQPVCVRQSAI